MSFVLKNGLVYFNGALRKANVLVDGAKIKDLGARRFKGAEKEIDCSGRLVFPAAIDAHVHFRTPGQEYKEDWGTGSSAALKGGVATVLDMPNNSPSIIDRKGLIDKRNLVLASTLCDFGLFLGATETNAHEILKAKNVAAVKVFMGSSTGSLLVEKDEALERVFSAAKKSGLLVTVHAEDEATIRQNLEKFRDKKSAKFHNRIRSSGAEGIAIERALKLQEKIGNRLHFAHVSTREGIELIAAAKKKGRKVSCEVTPHHLFLTEHEIGRLGNFGKMNPPLRSKEDRHALWKGIVDGTVDLIATDHAPHTVEEKKQGYASAPSGVPGVETMLPLLLNAVNEGKLKLERVAQLCCENPAKVYGLKGKGCIKKGFDADLIVVDLHAGQRIINERLFTKCRWSPFSGLKLKGVVEKTIVRGKLVYSKGVVNNAFHGKEVGFE
ncbi:MAG: dihydroorotase [Candidatus Diapherotrites archaeon]